MSFGNETFQNTNDRYSKLENIFMYICTCLLTISAPLNPPVPDHFWSNHSLYLILSFESEACHKKYDTEADADDTAVAARAWLCGHSPFPVIKR